MRETTSVKRREQRHRAPGYSSAGRFFHAWDEDESALRAWAADLTDAEPRTQGARTDREDAWRSRAT